MKEQTCNFSRISRRLCPAAALFALALGVSSCGRRTPPPDAAGAGAGGGAVESGAEGGDAARRSAAAAEAERRAAEEAIARENAALAAIDATRADADAAEFSRLRAQPPKGSKTVSTGRSPWRGAIAIDADTGRILFEDAADTPCLPASMVKLMVLLIAQERIEKGALRTNDMVSVSTRAFNTGGSQVYLDPRETFSVEDMLYAIIVQSANDAAVALSEHIAGSCEEMTALMNARAAELGMKNTVFSSVNGLPASPGGLNDISTPRDMAILSREVCKHPDALRYTAESYRVFRPEPHLFEMRTHNPALQAGTKIAGADGLKTGYTRRAGYSLAVSAKRAGRRVIAVSMGTAVPGAKGDLDSKESKRVRNAKISELVERAFAALDASSAPAGQ